MHPDEIAENLIVRLKDVGFRLLYYRSMSSDSHYLKLDGGVAHSVRISDHHSRKKHVVYRYNVITTETGHRWWHTKELRRGIYGPDMIDLMMRHIVAGRKLRMLKYSSQYTHMIEKNIIRCQNHKKLHLFKEI